LAALATGGAGGAIGLAAGYKYRHPLHEVWRATKFGGTDHTPGAQAFKAERARIIARLDQQTVAEAAALKARYAQPIFGEVRMWDMIEKLVHCIDPTDLQIFATSQIVHVKQVLAAMEREGVNDPNLYLAALLHDVGKLAQLTGAPPEHVFGGARRRGGTPSSKGLAAVPYTFGHAEFIYPRIKDHVPEPVAWTVRYHNIDIDEAAGSMTATERDWTERYLRPFRRYDDGFKSLYYVPDIDIKKYRPLIEDHFPKPIPF
jgi:hypothetical protein